MANVQGQTKILMNISKYLFPLLLPFFVKVFNKILDTGNIPELGLSNLYIKTKEIQLFLKSFVPLPYSVAWVNCLQQ